MQGYLSMYRVPKSKPIYLVKIELEVKASVLPKKRK